MEESPILDYLNPAQKAAVTSPASVIQILAPPGSGKTKTLTSRVAYILKHYKYQPWNIICVTFTIKSAWEMKERIAKLIGSGIEKKLVIGTFHSVCRRYLVTYGSKIGLKKGFGIADSSDSQAIIGRICKRLKLNIDPKAARSRVSSAKAKCQDVEHLRLALQKSKRQNVDQQEFLIIFEEYEKQLATSNLLDYDDLLLRCVELLENHPECVSNVEAVLIDEFQDTNNVQYQLMNLLARHRKRITTVGDPDQSIYGWRSAEILNLSRMRDLYPDTLVINLENNYRSAGSILHVALEVIEQDDSRPSKPLVPTHCPGTTPTFRKLPSAAAEAKWIVMELTRCFVLCGSSLLKHSDFSILLRSAALSRQIESALGKAGIPYRMVGGLRFFDRVEVKILLDYMRVVSQPDNSDALVRILNVPARGIGEATMRSLMEEARTLGISLYAFIKEHLQGNLKSSAKITKNMDQGLSSLFNLLVTCKKKLTDEENPLSPRQLLGLILKRLQFKEFLEKKYPEDHENRWANVEELVEQAEDCDFMTDAMSENNDEDALPKIEGVEQDGGNRAEEALTKFLANVALATEIQKDDEVNDETGQPVERVTISTIHAAKGLEWPVVFIPSVYEGSIPHSRAEDNDEERRLLYVAMTRAQALLYMSCPVRNSNSGETTPSSFLTTKKVQQHLAAQGPCLRTDRAVPDIAEILGRECPSQAALNEGLGKLDRIEDDLYPLDGEESAEQMAERGLGKTTDYGGDYCFATKRRKLDASGASDNNHQYSGFASARTTYSTLNTTMQNASSFTVKPNAGGFTSASSHLAFDRAQSAEVPKVATLGGKGRNAKGKGSGRAQGTLTALWRPQIAGAERPEGEGKLLARPGDCSSSSHARNELSYEKHESSSITHGADDDHLLPHLRWPGAGGPRQVQSHVQPRAAVTAARPRTPMASIPDSLSNHRLHQLPALSRPKISVDADEASGERKPYVFLSSSPPRACDAAPRKHAVRQRGAEDAARDDWAEINVLPGDADHFPCENNTKQSVSEASDALQQRPQAGSRMLKPASAPTAANVAGYDRPAATFHDTSLAQIQARSNTKGWLADTNTNSNAQLQQRRRLGVNRNIGGWKAKPFKAPTRLG